MRLGAVHFARFVLLIVAWLAMLTSAFAGRDLSGGGTVFYLNSTAKPILLDFAVYYPEIFNLNLPLNSKKLSEVGFTEGDSLRWDDPRLDFMFSGVVKLLRERFADYPFLMTQMMLGLEGLGLRYTLNTIENVHYETPTDFQLKYPDMKLVHVVSYTEENGAFLNAKLFDSLSVENQMGLILHEILRVIQYRMYAFKSDSTIHLITSQLVFEGYLGSEKFDFENPDLYISEFHDKISSYRLSASPIYFYDLMTRVCSGLNSISAATQGINDTVSKHFTSVFAKVFHKTPNQVADYICNNDSKYWWQRKDDWWQLYLYSPGLKSLAGLNDTQFARGVEYKSIIFKLQEALAKVDIKLIEKDEFYYRMPRIIEFMRSDVDETIRVQSFYNALLKDISLDIFTTPRVKESAYQYFEFMMSENTELGFSMKNQLASGLSALYNLMMYRQLALARQEMNYDHFLKFKNYIYGLSRQSPPELQPRWDIKDQINKAQKVSNQLSDKQTSDFCKVALVDWLGKESRMYLEYYKRTFEGRRKLIIGAAPHLTRIWDDLEQEGLKPKDSFHLIPAQCRSQ